MSASPILVLDIDGVITQPAPDWPAKLKDRFGIEVEDLNRGFFEDPQFAQVLAGRLDLLVALHDWLEPQGLGDRLQEFVGFWFDHDSVIDREVLGLADAWRARTGGRVMAASNQEHHRATWLRDHAGLGRHVEDIVYSAALGVCKPERVFFTNAQARMGVTVAQSILFVDDRTVNVDGARMAGWRSMLYRGRDGLSRALEGWS